MCIVLNQCTFNPKKINNALHVSGCEIMIHFNDFIIDKAYCIQFLINFNLNIKYYNHKMKLSLSLKNIYI